MRIPLVLAMCSALSAFAQFSSMATDYAGQRLLFTTNLSQTGSGQPDYGKLFVADRRGVTPLLIYNYDVLSTNGLYPGQSGLLTNFYYVDGVDVSSNGAYISVVAERDCDGYTAGLCGYADRSTLYDTSGQVALMADGRVILSRDGKWAMAIENALYGATSLVLYDMTAGEQSPASDNVGFVDWREASVSDDGTAVAVHAGQLFLYRPRGGGQQITLSSGVQSATLGQRPGCLGASPQDRYRYRRSHTVYGTSGGVLEPR